MRKYLLATTALAAATGLTAISAPANAAEKLSLRVGGYFQAYYAFIDEKKDSGNNNGIINTGEPAADRRSHWFLREAEIHFLGEVALDNGMKVGVDVQLEAETCGDQIDESYLYFQGDFGKVILGSENSAAYLMSYGAPAVDSSFDGADPNYRLPQPGGNQAVASQAYVPNITGDSEKITYISPRFAGFAVGVSYTPDNHEEANIGFSASCPGGSFGGAPCKEQAGQQEDIFEFGLNFERKFGDFGILAGLTYGFGNLESNTGLGNAEDRDQFTAGLNVTYAGFTVGAGYYWDDNGISTNGDTQAIAAGLAWANGPLRLGASFLYNEYEQCANNPVTSAVCGGQGDDKLYRYVVGGSYTYAPGMQARGTVQYYDAKGPNNTVSPANDNNDAWVAVVGTVISF